MATQTVVAVGAIISAAASVASVAVSAAADVPSPPEPPKKEIAKQKETQLDQVENERKQRELERAREEAEKRRLARIKAARVASGAGGAGVSGSILSSPIASIESSLESDFSYSEKMDKLQEEQYAIQREQIDIGANLASRQTQSASTGKDYFSLISEGVGAAYKGIKAGVSLYNEINTSTAPAVINTSTGYYAPGGF